jgi:hypothetical protein
MYHADQLDCRLLTYGFDCIALLLELVGEQSHVRPPILRTHIEHRIVRPVQVVGEKEHLLAEAGVLAYEAAKKLEKSRLAVN